MEDDECEATQYMNSHKSGSTGCIFGWCGAKNKSKEEDELN
jgi:hypothetical protein